MALEVDAIAIIKSETAPDNLDCLWNDSTVETGDIIDRVKVYDDQEGEWVSLRQSSSISAGEVLNKLLTVDGEGSGLDADKLDGLDSTAFQRKGGAEDVYWMVATTTDGTATELTEEGTGNSIEIPDNTHASVAIQFVARQTAGSAGSVGDGASSAWLTNLSRESGTYDVTGTSSLGIITNGAISGFITVDDNSGAGYRIRYTGATDKTINCRAKVTVIKQS